MSEVKTMHLAYNAVSRRQPTRKLTCISVSNQVYIWNKIELWLMTNHMKLITSQSLKSGIRLSTYVFPYIVALINIGRCFDRITSCSLYMSYHCTLRWAFLCWFSDGPTNRSSFLFAPFLTFLFREYVIKVPFAHFSFMRSWQSSVF